MATGTLFPAPWFTVLDADGDPVVGAKGYFYLAGTTTLVATYSDVTLLTANANPVISDASGRMGPVYLSPGASFKFVLQDSAGASIRTQDNISAVPASSSNVDISGVAGEALTAGQVVYLSDGSGGKTAGSWYKADNAIAYSSSAPQLGMVTASIASGASGTIRLIGIVTGLTSLTVGTSYYTSGTAGGLTVTPALYSRFVGVADTTSSLVINRDPPNFGSWTLVGSISTGAQNNWAPGLVGNTVITWTGASDAPITGIAGGVAGQFVTIKNFGTQVATFAYASASSAAANKIYGMVQSAPTPIAPNGHITFYYTGANWLMVDHEQGSWIVPTFSAGDYTASSGTWTVDSGDVIAARYKLTGYDLKVNINIGSTDVSATPTTLIRAVPGGFSAAVNTIGAGFAIDAAGTRELLLWSVTTTAISFSLGDASAWATTTSDNTSIWAQVECEIT